MATTSIWSVKSTLGHVIEYAADDTKTANPQWSKSEYQSMRDVMDYAMNDFKTEQQYYVTALNCDAGCAREQMQLTKRQFGKTDGILAFHGYQSFAEGEVDADTAHAIGIKLAAELWPEYQVIVATHLNTHCFHNHFVLNSVSYLDGKKFNACKESYLKMRAASDRLCKEYGLSVITEHTAYYPKHYAEWDAERKGQPTWRSAIREDVDKAIMASMSFQAFLRSLRSMGYEVKTGVKHMAVRPPGKERFVRLRSLGERYTEDAIRQRILKQCAPERPAKCAPSIPLRIRVYGDFHLSKVTWKGLRALYFFYLRKLRRTQRAQQCNVPYVLREDLRHLDAILSPRAYYYQQIGQENPLNESMTWNSNTVMQLLRNPVYIGNMVQGKRRVTSMTFNTKQYDGRTYYIYKCSRYAVHGKSTCSIHHIPASALEEAVLQNIRFNAQLLSENDEELLEKLIALGNRGQQCEMQEARTKLNEAVKRLEVVEDMAQKLFEERCTGNVPDSVFKKLMQNYDIEQANLNHVIAEKRNTLMEIENASVDISAWAEEFKQYTNIDKLNRKIVTKLIDSVEVHESTKENGVIKQHVTVNYKFVGQLSA